MEEKAKLVIIMDGHSISAEVEGRAEEVMVLVKEALLHAQRDLEKRPGIDKETSMALIDEVIESYQVEAKYGGPAAMLYAL